MHDLAYWVMVPLSLVEGPIVALAAGAGMATGQVNPVVAGSILALGAVFQDTVYYWLGRLAIASSRIRALATRVHLLRNTLPPLEAAWRNALFATLLGSKFAYGLYAPMLVTAGMARAPFGRFLALSLAVSAVLLGGWFAAGYGLVRAYGALGERRYASFVVTGVGLVGLVALFFIARHVSKRLNPKLSGAGRGERAEDAGGSAQLAVEPVRRGANASRADGDR
jgi:membrane protein DedA with SNARE-associated domain